jgi:hypothetical protein
LGLLARKQRLHAARPCEETGFRDCADPGHTHADAGFTFEADASVLQAARFAYAREAGYTRADAGFIFEADASVLQAAARFAYAREAARQRRAAIAVA